MAKMFMEAHSRQGVPFQSPQHIMANTLSLLSGFIFPIELL
jgi:hypothetical protein